MIQKDPNTAAMNPRTSRKASLADDGPQFVVIEGAPKHYVSGFGVVGPGAIVTLAKGVKPGKFLQPVHPRDAAKASASQEDADKLAAAAADKDKEKAAAAAKPAETAAAK